MRLSCASCASACMRLCTVCKAWPGSAPGSAGRMPASRHRPTQHRASEITDEAGSCGTQAREADGCAQEPLQPLRGLP